MSEEMQILYEKLSFFFETRMFADLRILTLDLEPADIAVFMENNLDEKEQIGLTQKSASPICIN